MSENPNLYFFDTEFIEDGKTIELVSIGIAAGDGRTYYAEVEGVDYSRADPWLHENVFPHLTGETKPREQIAAEIAAFVGEKPAFWAYYADYDWVALCQLYGRMIDLPKSWPMFCRDVKQLCVSLGGPKLPKQTTTEHHALADAIDTMAKWRFLTADRDQVLVAVADGLAARLRHEIAGLETPAMRGDCLAVMLASDFEAWADEDEETDDSGTWKQSAVDATDGVLDSITGLCRDAIYAALLSERHRAEEAKWLPIDTAPKDGTRLLLCWAEADGLGEHVELGRWRGGWGNTYGRPFVGDPDYFMPLPLTPEPTHER